MDIKYVHNDLLLRHFFIHYTEQRKLFIFQILIYGTPFVQIQIYMCSNFIGDKNNATS